ncbi:hypothetical protein [uncultured Desulfosarcina sp.]|uniref:hypothetical protein n=1 Tax=uncultured Desulfosarcina sp. TaxID=218289 RepID=UPI0029C892C9|nr:hypothetical protein [uncultured Desulfosarcina sp.]
MTFQLFHFRDSDRILKEKSMLCYITLTMEHVFNAIKGVYLRNTLLRTVLDEMGWHQGDVWNIIAGRRCRYLGYKNGVAIEASFTDYSYIAEGLTCLQLGYDKGQIDVGILLLTTRGIPAGKEKDTSVILNKDMGAMEPTIRLPVCICLYDFGDSVIGNCNNFPS